jgi:hypothetical protein
VRQGAKVHVRCFGLLLVSTAGLLAGCAEEHKNGDPGARPLPAGVTCESIKSELNSLDGKGVPSLIEGQQAGRKLNAGQQAQVDQYNKLLSDYLGARCHVPPGH